MYPYIHIILPSYTVMALVGGFFALCIMYFRLEKVQIEFTSFLKIFLVGAIGCWIGSKLLFAMTRIPWLIENFTLSNLIWLIPSSGYVFYGGLFGVIFTILIVTRKDADLRKRVFFLAVPAMPLFHAFGRIGCFLSGCCYGKKLASPFTVGPIAFYEIPVQLFEALAELIIFAVIMIAAKKNRDTNLLRLYLMIYACVRFADEFLRGDEIRGIYFGLSTAQWISLIILITYLVKFIKNRKTVEVKTA